MARISSYNQDDSLNKLDKVLGTDSGTGATKNYTIESLADTINEAGLVQVFDGAHYVFQSYVEPANNPQGVVNFNQSTASTVQYGNINTIYISVDDANGMFLADYLTNANGDYIKLNKRDDLNNFGIYKITNIAQPHSAYRTLTVQALSSAGFCQPGDKLFLSNYSARFETQLADHSVTELNDVTDAGSGRIITDSERSQMAYLNQHGLVHQDVINNLTSELEDWPLSANQGRVLNEAVQAINNLLTSDNVELDSLQEVVDFIEANRDTLDALAISNIAGLQDALDAKEPRVEGKGLSANDFTDELLQKLNDIAANAEVNVQADWNETQAVSDAFILNKPSDITDLSAHNATELNDINDVGSGSIITGDERTKLGNITSVGSGSIITGEERTKLAGIDVDATARTVSEGGETITVPPANAEQNVQADWSVTDATSDAFIQNKPALAPSNAEQNVQANWTENDANSDAFILNKPTDVTDLGNHSVTELNDISSTGSGAIITNEERQKLSDIAEGAEVNVQADWNETVSTSDSFILNKPDLAPANAEANVQADWDETDTSADSYIQNKPTLAPSNAEQNVQVDWNETNNTSDSFILNKPALAPSDAEANVQANWDETDTTSDAYIQNKPALAPSNAEQNVQANWNETDNTSDAFIQNKPALAPSDAEANVQANWNETNSLSDAFIQNKPTDVTDLSGHDATELNDITSVGSGAIITADERQKLADIAENAEVNVQADWNETNNTSDAFILNKPTLAPSNAEQNVQVDWSETDNTSDAFILNKPALAPSNAEQNVQADWNESDNTSDAFILNKPSVVETSRTIQVQGSLNEIVVSPNTAQDLSDNRTFTIGLPNDVTVSSDLTVGDTIQLSNAQGSTPSFDNGIYYKTEDGHDTLHFRYHGHDLSIDHLTENIPTGILNGGVLSKANNTQFTIAAGDGVINVLNKSNSDPHPEIVQIQWSQGTYTVDGLDSNNTNQLNSWIYIDNTGAVQQQSTPLTDAQKRSNILIGSAIHSEGVLKFVKTFPLTGYNNMSQISEFIQTFGPMKKSGHRLSANGANLSIDRANGVSFALGRNYATDPLNPSTVTDGAKTQCVIHRYYQDGSGGFVLDDGTSGNGYTVIDPTKYDDGSGTLATVSGGHYSVQRFYYFPGTPDIVIAYYGHDEYNSLDEAENNYNKEDFVEAGNTAEQAIYLGAIIVKGGATALNAAGDAKFLTAGTFRSLAAVNVGGGISGDVLNDLTDVNVQSPSNDDVLRYNATTQQFENVSDSILPITLDTVNNRVGINNTTPHAELVVNGKIDTSDVTNGAFRIYNGSTFRGGWGTADWVGNNFGNSSSDLVAYVNGTNKYFIGTNNQPRLTITGAGNVGINETNPNTASQLEVNGQTRIIGGLMAGNADAGNVVATGVQVHLKNTGAAKLRLEDSDSGNLAFDLVSEFSTGFSIVETVGGDTGDNTRLFIEKATGRIGVGTITPSNQLHLKSTGANASALIVEDNARKLEIGRDQIVSKDVTNGNATNLYINPNANTSIATNGGNVGIGIASGSHKLDVRGVVNINSGADKQLRFSGTSKNSYSFEHDASRIYLYDETSTAARLVIMNSGNIGIGTTGPQRQLEIRNASGQGEALLSGTSGTYLYFRPSNAYSAAGNFGIKTTGLSSGTYESTMTFTGYYSGNSNLMTLKGSGSVGIGTSSPHFYATYKHLTIDGTVGAGYMLRNNGSNAYEHYANSTQVIHYALGTRTQDWYTNGQHRMTLSSGGFLGIGISSAPWAKLHVNGAEDLLAYFKSTDNKAAIAIADDDTETFISAENGVLSMGGNMGVNADNLNYKLSNKRLGLGVVSPGAKLHIVSGDGIVQRIEGNNSSYTSMAIANSGTGAATLWFDASDGDLAGSDYAAIRQSNLLNLESYIGSAGGHFKWVFGTSDLMTLDNTGYLHLNQTGKGITFYGNSDKHHSISSTSIDGGAADDIRINSYGQVLINLDSNNNQTNGNNSSFKIGRHAGTGSISDILFRVDGETGNTFATGNSYISGNSFVFGTTTSTGNYINYDAANSRIRIFQGGTARAIFNSAGIQSSGNVYTGTTGQFRNYAGEWLATTGTSSGDARFVLNGLDVMKMKAGTGHVGIGTNTPAKKLHVVGPDGPTSRTAAANTDTAFIIENAGTNGAIQEFWSDNDGKAYIMFSDVAAGNRGYIKYNHSNDTLSLASNNTERIFFTSSGHVGLGTGTTAGSMLRIQDNTSRIINATTPGTTAGTIHIKPGSADHAGASITFGASDSSNDAQAGIYTQTDGGYGSRMYIATTNSYASGSKTRIFIDEEGRVGVNTVNPSTYYQMSVNGGLYVPGSLNVTGAITHGGNDIPVPNQMMAFQSTSDFTNGVKVSTDIVSSNTNGDSFVMEVTGKSYSSGKPPHKFLVQGYLYNNGIINYTAVDLSNSFAQGSSIKIWNDNGNLAFWWPRQGYWNSYYVRVHRASNTGSSTKYGQNRVTGISNSTDPGSSASKYVSVPLRQALVSDSNNGQYQANVLKTNYINRASGSTHGGNTAIELNDGTYTMIRTPESVRALYLGDSADARNYYDNTEHVFRAAGGNSEYARIKNNGNFGIGTNNALQKLVVSNGNAGLEVIPADTLQILQGYNRATSAYTNMDIHYGGVFKLQQNGNTPRITMSGATCTVHGVLTTDTGSDRYIRAFHSDGAYSEIRGYGLIMSRTSAYIRPTTNGSQQLYIGYNDNSINWLRIKNYVTSSFTVDVSGVEKFKVASDYIKIPSSTATAGVTGALRFNTTEGKFEGHNGTEWAEIAGGDDYTPLTVTKDSYNRFQWNFNAATNFKMEASGTWHFVPATITNDLIGKSGVIIISNTGTTNPGALPSNFKTPNGDNIVWETDSGDTAIVSYFIVSPSIVLINYIGNFG